MLTRPKPAPEPAKIDIEVLANQGMKLLSLDLDALHATLGAQLLGQKLPTRIAGLLSYLSAIRNAAESKQLYEALPAASELSQWGRGLAVIHEELKQDGIELLESIGDELRKALNNDDLLHLSDQINRSTMQVVIIVVGACLRIPREYDPICATVAAILLKQGLRNFCGLSKGTA
jgi:hypothetical protein